MSINPAEILEQKLRAFVEKAPRIAGVYAVGQFRENIRRRGGVPVNGNLEPFEPRAYDTQRTRGKKILLGTGNLVDSIRLINATSSQALVGISQRDINKYARIHNEGGTIIVTKKMKSFFWAMFYQSSGSVQKTKKGEARKTKRNEQLTGDAAFYKAMALKKVGSKITIPKREFMRLTPDLNKGIMREFEYAINKIKDEVKKNYNS